MRWIAYIGWLLGVVWVRAQPPYEPKWLFCGEVEIGVLASEREANFRVVGTTQNLVLQARYADGQTIWQAGQRIAGEQRFTIRLARTRWGIAKGDLILSTQIGGRFEGFTYRVALNGQEMGTWRLEPDPAGYWRDAFFLIPVNRLQKADGSMPDQVEISLLAEAPAFAYRHRVYTADLSSLVKGFKPGALEVQNLPGEAGNFLRGLEAIGRHQWQQAGVFLGQVALRAEAPLARAARHWLRYALFRQNPLRDPYRAGLYALVNGWSEEAVQAFARALERDPADPDLLYHYALAREYRGDNIQEIADLFAQSADRYGVKTPNRWRTLVVVYQKAKNERGELLEMKPEEVEKIVRNWRIVEAMVAAASRGWFRLETTWKFLPDESQYPLQQHGGMMLGPADSILSTWGEYDSVMSFRPGGPSVSAGADVGPNGAALTDIGTWCDWEVYLHEWNHQFDWTSIVSEVGTGYPPTHDSDACGLQPIPTMGAGHRNSMRYYFTPAMYRRLRAAAPHGGTRLLEWSLSEVQPFEGDRLENSVVLTPPDQFTRRVVQEDEFLDLAGLSPNAPAKCLQFARCFVWSPRAQEVRLRLGMNDTMRVWLNGQVVYRGAYKAVVKWEDRNLPDMINAWARLEKGWNELICAVVRTGGGWGFSVRLTDLEGKPLEGLRFQAEPPRERIAQASLPATGIYYRWRDVRDDFTQRLPRLTEVHLRALTGYATLALKERLLIDYGEASPPPGARRWDGTDKAERELNNRLNWDAGERMAAIRFYKPEGKRTRVRDLLFLRLEAMELILPLLRDRKVDEQILGYVYLKEGGSPRCVIVAEAELGDYPFDEADLLAP